LYRFLPDLLPPKASLLRSSSFVMVDAPLADLTHVRIVTGPTVPPNCLLSCMPSEKFVDDSITFSISRANFVARRYQAGASKPEL
jgi:hypothetical protein